MQLGVNLSMIFTEVPLIERFALAHQAGFKTIEIQFPYELSIEQIKQQLEHYQLKLCLINVPAGDLMQGGLGLACIPDRKVEFAHALHQAIDYAKALQVPRLNVLSGREPSPLHHHECRETFLENLNLAGRLCLEHKIDVVFELINGIDMPNFLIQHLEDVEYILKLRQYPNISLQFDCYHIAKIGENPLTALQHYLPDIGHIQFADVPDRHEPLTGNLNFQDIFSYLRQSPYKGYVCAEYRPKYHSQASFAWKQHFFTDA